MSKSKKNSLADRLKKVFFHADGKSLNRERLVKAGSVLACVVAFTTTYALILPAVTLEGTPRCEQEEHVHTEACYQAQDAGAAGQFETLSTKAAPGNVAEAAGAEPVCGQEEHKHTLACYSDPEADTDASGWEQAADRAVSGLSDDAAKTPAERVLAVAQSQKGYRESEKNYQVLEDGRTKRGFTVYGNAYGTPYDDWSTLFVKWCIDRAGVEDYLFETDCSAWAGALQAQGGLWKTTDPKAGDLIFLDLGDTGRANQIGIIERVDTSRNGAKTTLRVIEGNSGDRVQLMSYASNDERILGYAVIPADQPLNPDATANVARTDETANADAQTTGDADVGDDANADIDAQNPAGTDNNANSDSADSAVDTETPADDRDADTQNDSDKEHAADITDAQNNTGENDGADSAAQNTEKNSQESDETADNGNMTADPSESSDTQDADQSDNAGDDGTTNPEDSSVDASAENDDAQTGDSTRNHKAADAADNEDRADGAVDDNPTSETDDAAIEALKDAQKGKNVFEKISDTIKDLLTPSVRKEVSVGDVSVTVEYNEGVLPEDVLVDVVTVDADAYTDVISETTGLENPVVHAFDVKFLSDGREVEPDGVVTVTFEADYIKASTEPEVVHISDDGVGERIDTRVTDGELTLNADSFSVYAIVYTVDFSYGDLEYNLKGNDAISLADLFEKLNIHRDISDVKTVTFSNNKVLKVHRDGILGLVGEWVLESVEPFDTSEMLTVAFQDGSILEIAVTDDVSDEDDPLGLSGKSLAIVNTKSGQNGAVMASVNSGRLTRTTVTMRAEEGVLKCSDSAPAWSFEYIGKNDKGEPQYLVHYGQYYISVNGENNSSHSISLVSRSDAEKNPVVITEKNGKYLFKNNKGQALNHYGSNGFGAWTADDSNSDEWMSLCEPKLTNPATGKPITVDTEDTRSAGFRINLFDFGPDQLDQVSNTYNTPDYTGLNDRSHILQFYAYGTNGSGVNNFTGGPTAHQGIVQSTLDADGYPVAVADNGRTTESLKYLFDENDISGGSKKVYRDVNHLFQLHEPGYEGYYRYDSDKFYAYYDTAQGDSGNFKVYNGTYMEEGGTNQNPFFIGLFPFNDYDERYRCIHGDNFRWNCTGSKNTHGVSDEVGHYNHHFGISMDGDFIMPADKKVDGKDMIFEFSGDDDMWVFIDGVLVLDIGGIHNPVDGKINFTTGEVTVSDARTVANNSGSALTANTTIEKAFGKANATWDPSPNSKHEIKIFYMERGGMYSNCEITFNIPTVSLGNVELNKTDTNGTPLKDAKFELYSDPECKTRVTDKGIVIETINTTNEFPNLVVKNIPVGVTYYLKEVKAPDGYQVDPNVYVVQAPSNETASKVYVLGGNPEDKVTSIKNIKDDVKGSIEFWKADKDHTETKLEGAVFALYTDAECQKPFKIDENTAYQVTSSSDSSTKGKVIFKDLPAGTTYYFKEITEPTGYIPSTAIYKAVIDDEGQTTIYGEDGQVIFNKLIINEERKPKETSVTVEKEWKDGNQSHTNDKVILQLYRVVGTPKIDIPVRVEWENEDVDHGNDASIEVQFKIEGDKKGSVTLNDDNWSGTVELDLGQEYTIELVKSGTKVGEVEIENGTTYKADGSGIVVKAKTQEPPSTRNVPVSISWPTDVEIPDSVTLIVTGGDLNGSERSITLSKGNWNGHVPGLTVGETYNLSWNPSDVLNQPPTSIKVSDDNEITVTGKNPPAQYTIELKIDKNSQKILNTLTSWQLSGSLWDYADNGSENDYTKNISNYFNYAVGSFSYAQYTGKDHIAGFAFKCNTYNLDNAYEYRLISNTGGVYTPLKDGYIYIDKDTTELTLKIVSKTTGETPTAPQGAPRLRRMNAPEAQKSSTKIEANKLGDDGTAVFPKNAVDYEPGGTGTVTLNNGINGWSYTWTGLPAEDTTSGETIYYYVKEISVELEEEDPDSVVTSYVDYVYNEDGNPGSGIKSVKIVNEVFHTTSLQVTKEWYKPDGSTPYIPVDGTQIEFQICQLIDGNAEGVVYKENPMFPDGKGKITWHADTGWDTVTIDKLPEKVKVGDQAKDVSYYVKEIDPVADDTNLVTYYKKDQGKRTSEPSETAGAKKETIINIQGRKELKVTKRWYFDDNGKVTEAAEPPEKTVYFKLMMINKDDNTDSGYYPNGGAGKADGTKYTISWTPTDGWSTVSFTNLPSEYNGASVKYRIVEVDSNGNPLRETAGNKIQYRDPDEKEMTAENNNFIDENSTGIYTINNIQKETSLYVEKIWWGANKENLAEGKEVWFQLYRAKSKNGTTYDASTVEAVGDPFSFSQQSGWVRRIDHLQTAPVSDNVGDDSGDKYYYWYYVEELGIAKGNGTYEPIQNMRVLYQSRGSGTTNGSAYAEYKDGITTAGSTDSKVKIETWANSYNGTGTLGVFNSSESFYENDFTVKKNWKSISSQGSTDVASQDTADYVVELQLVQVATFKPDPQGESITRESNYGTPFLVSKNAVRRQSDSYYVEPVANQDWGFQIPKSRPGMANTRQLPSRGSYMYDGAYYMANFTYYVSEYRVYESTENTDVTEMWSPNCRISSNGTTFDVDNYRNSNLTLIKAWENVSPHYRNTNVTKLLFKVKCGNEDITEKICKNPAHYGLNTENVYLREWTDEQEVGGSTQTTYLYEYYLVMNPGTTSDGITANWSAEANNLKIQNLDIYVRNEKSEAENPSWTKLDYTVQEVGYIDGSGVRHEIADLDGSGSGYPKYQVQDADTPGNSSTDWTSEATDCESVQVAPDDAAKVRVTNTATGLLKVHKRWLDANGDDTTPWAESITFKLQQIRKLASDETTVLPAIDYTVDEAVKTYTVSKGLSDDTSEQWQTIVTDLPLQVTVNNAVYNCYYKVVEIDSESSNKLVSSALYENNDGTDSDISPIEVKNRKTVDVQILKTDSKVQTKHLKGAVFKLSKPGDNDFTFEATQLNPETNKEEAIIFDSNKKGQFEIQYEASGVTIKALTPGTYKLEEIEPPSGYCKLLSPVEFVVKDDGTVTQKDGAAFQQTSSTLLYQFARTDLSRDVKFTVLNEPGAELPSTGGAGTGWFYGVGGALALLAGSGLIRMRRRRSAVKQD